MKDESQNPLAAQYSRPGSGRAKMNFKAGKVEAAVEVDINPSTLLAIGGLVSMILLSVPPIIRAAKDARSPRQS